MSHLAALLFPVLLPELSGALLLLAVLLVPAPYKQEQLLLQAREQGVMEPLQEH
jgi:hypothetical protein